MKQLPKPTRSASLGFVDMWQRSRPQTAPEASKLLPSGSRPQPCRRSSGSQASPGPSSPSSPGFSYFPFKPSRRVSNPTPVPRTQPYLYPYFAAPPVGTPQDYVKFSLQVEGTIRSSGSTTVTENSSRTVEKKEANAQAQASLGYGRRPSGRRVVSALP
ncbi:hypothetical protein CPB85DRAFT_7443 [Mucidula mucida]|nr:hypothetical protein CPB85DRAFT_7443 [Mucidula mucida]